MQQGREVDVGQYRIDREPFYAEVRGEIGLFTVAANSKMPVMLKGPTGCGKTRFVQHMAYRLGRPLITVACHEDLTAPICGRYLLKGQRRSGSILRRSVKHGAIVYLTKSSRRGRTRRSSSILSDDRRFLPIEKKGQILEAADDFLLVISYNPGYQSVLKDLKQSTKQRFIAIEFDYPAPDVETTVVEREAGVSRDLAASLVKLGGKVRNLKNHGLEEGVSTRLLIYAGTLIRQGVATDRACDVAIARPITDDPDMQRSILELVKAIF
jgi:nitric oxide reductase NorQ protein